MYVLGHIYSTFSSFGYREDNDLLGNLKTTIWIFLSIPVLVAVHLETVSMSVQRHVFDSNSNLTDAKALYL